MVKNPFRPLASTASFSPRSATRTARIGPSGGGSSPKRRRSALLNGRSHANAFPPTNHVRLPWRSPSVTSGSAAAICAASSRVATSLLEQRLAKPREHLAELVVRGEARRVRPRLLGCFDGLPQAVHHGRAELEEAPRPARR